jgi:putative aldouronate transport system permease protein
MEAGWSRLARLVKESWRLYVLLIPAILFVAIFRYAPMFGLQLAFKSYSPRLGIWASPWVGFGQFVRFFSYYRFGQVFLNTAVLALYKLAVGFPLPIILALCLNEVRNRRLKKTIQTITYAPYFISVVVVVGITTQLFNAHYGPLGSLAAALKGSPIDVMSDPKSFRHLFVWTDVWQLTGYQAILYIAALSAVNPELYEAAAMDGASKFRRILSIDVPALMPTATILLILEAGRVMDISFEKVILLQSSLNLRTSEVLTTYIYKAGLLEGQFDFATAGGLFNSAINFCLVVAVNKIASKLGETSLW